MPGGFVHLHVHSEYSLLDGANRIKDLIQRAKELNMDSIAITDHGAMYGVIDFYQEAQNQGIKPIIGCEVYVAPRTIFDKEINIDDKNYHLILLAENNTGYRNLVKLVSIASVEGFYFRPRVDKDILRKYSDGLIALSACMGGEIPTHILNNNYKRAFDSAKEYKEIFGEENFYLELQINGIEEQALVNQGLIQISKELNIPLVATNDVHYLKRSDAKAQEVLMCIQTGKRLTDEDRMMFTTDEFYLKSSEEMEELFKSIPEALENTRKIADRCQVEIEFGKPILPEFKIPNDETPFNFLKKLCYEGMKERYGYPTPSHVVERVDYELSVINNMGYVDYYLIVWDFIKYAKDNGIIVGPGRGSGAGSVAAYCLGITNIDSLKYNLIFERFLNPERVSMPDFDVDFCYERRGEVIDYVVRKYGADKVAQIITFGTLQARAAIKDVGRVLDIPYAEVDKIAKMIPNGVGVSIKKALSINPDLKNLYDNDYRVKELIDISMQLEGMPRHSSTHAAGVVIARDPLTEYVPVQKSDDNIVTQFSMGILDKLGLLKVDFLGLRTLTVIKDTVDMVKENYNVDIDLDNMTYDDQNVYKIISQGHTAGIFQMESAGMTRFLKELKPSCFEDIIAGIALYRPGPMDQIPRYIENKNDPLKITYLCPQLEPILNVTYGCIIYQEQVMQIVRDLAGYSYGRSDLVRRAMSKKNHDVMERERKNFIYGIVDDEGNIIVPGAIRNGISEKVANEIFDLMLDFASYAFNKSHATAYAVVGYQTGWLKYYYPVEFMAALLNSFLTNSGKIAEYVVECKNLNIKILPPDINESGAKFTVINNQIRFGLTAVKNVGLHQVETIIKERNENGKYANFFDFCKRNAPYGLNKKCVESLIKAGAFDSFEVRRAQLLAVYEKTIDSLHLENKKLAEGQISLFEMEQVIDESAVSSDIQYPDIPEYEPRVLLSMEKSMLGFYLSGHPLEAYEDKLKKIRNIVSTDINLNNTDDDNEYIEDIERVNLNISDNMPVVTGGIVENVKVKLTKNGQRMAFVDLEDMYGIFEMIVFPNVFEKYISLLFEGAEVIVNGRLSISAEETPKIIVESLAPISVLDKVKVNNYKEIHIIDNGRTEIINAVLSLLEYFSGETPVTVIIKSKDSRDNKIYKYNVSFNETLTKRLKFLLNILNS